MDILHKLIELHKTIFNHAYSKSEGKKTIPLFSYRAPGNIGIDNLELSNLNLDYESLPESCQNLIKEVFNTGSISNQYPLFGEGLSSGLVDSFLNGIRLIHLLSVVTNPSNSYQEYLNQAVIHSMNIMEWIQNGTQSKSLVVIIQPQVNLGEFTSIGKWIQKKLTMPELCVEAHLGFQSPQEACERVFTSSYFERDLNTFELTRAEILAEVDVLTLSLWLALGNIYRTQDIRCERRPWSFSPDDESPLGIKFQLIWENTLENLRLQTFTRMNNKRKLMFFPEALTIEHHKKVNKWMEIISANRKAIYGLNMICDGVRDIARSVGEQSFRKDKIARDGIFKLISGLEGLNSECKPINRAGHKIDATNTFIDCWSVVWKKMLLLDPENQYLSKTKDIKAALADIYALRSVLAHSDPSMMETTFRKVKSSIGDTISSNEVDPSSIGIAILIIIDELIDLFFTHENVLVDMLNGVKPQMH